MTNAALRSEAGAVKNSALPDILAMFVVCFLSLLLLVYVGIGEGQRTYVGFLSSKMAAQGEIVQNAMAGHLRAGLALRQFVGFQTLSTQIFESDPTVLMITATDRSNKVVFTNKQSTQGRAVPDTFDVVADAMKGEKVYFNDRFEARQSDGFITAVLPLKSKFETVGSLWVVMPRSVVQDKVGVALLPMLGFIAVLSALFSWLVVSVKGGDEKKRTRRQEIGLAACFLLTSVVVVGLLVALYSDGAQAKAKALSSSLSERVGAISDSRIELADIDGIDRSFADYRAFNKDIESIGLLRGGNYVIHTEAGRVGTAWKEKDGTFEYKVKLPDDPQGQKQEVTVALPVDVVYKAIGNSAKNFIVLFFASGFLAALVLQLANAVRKVSHAKLTKEELDSSALEKVKPVLFLAVFVDNLSASFLPQLIRGYADTAQAPAFMTSVAFMAYFICFAAILVPAGKWAQRIGAKPLLWSGAVGIALGLGILVATTNFNLIILARILEGFGQGILFIGVQTLVLSASSSANQTKANGIIVYNFNAGMVSGMAIGSLLVLYMGTFGVFMFGLIGIVALTAYIVAVIPPLMAPEEKKSDKKSGAFQVIRSFEFLRVMLLVGIPSKAVLTGVIIFGLPILLSQMAFESDEIGQIIMFYALGVLLANSLVSKTKIAMSRVLSGGMLLGSLGLVAIGLLGLLGQQWATDHAVLMSLGLVVGVLAVGLGHGAINAPVVTYVANTNLAKNAGVVTTTSLYRVIERVGHVVGPMIVGQLLILSGQSVLLVGWIGAALLLFTILFQFGQSGRVQGALAK
jgi:predicted MFS family arabinose efflux permease